MDARRDVVVAVSGTLGEVHMWTVGTLVVVVGPNRQGSDDWCGRVGEIYNDPQLKGIGVTFQEPAGKTTSWFDPESLRKWEAPPVTDVEELGAWLDEA